MQERPHEDVGVQRQASLFFYGEGGSGETASTEDKLVRELSFDVTRRVAVAKGSRCLHDKGRGQSSVSMVGVRSTSTGRHAQRDGGRHGHHFVGLSVAEKGHRGQFWLGKH